MDIQSYTYRLIEPRSKDEDKRRREFILNILLIASIILFAFASISSVITSFLSNSEDRQNNALSLVIVILTLFVFVVLYFLSRRGFINVSTYVFTGIYFSFASYLAYHWGPDVPSALLFYILTIVMAGILISSRMALLTTFLTSFFIILINNFQLRGMIELNSYWRTQRFEMADSLVVSVILFIITTVSWLSNREISRALIRARRSEEELKKERDMLEVNVEERTQELKMAQLERISQLYRFAEFGRLSSGAFHDMTNLLTALSLNIEKIQSHQQQLKSLNSAKSYLEQAILATNRISFFIRAVRKQMAGHKTKVDFSLQEEIAQVIEILSYKAKSAGVEIIFLASKDIIIHGDQIKFNQVVTNLVSNAIDAYKNSPKTNRRVEISLKLENGSVNLSVKDWGTGIPVSIQEKIFEPFFTTKDFSQGTGIGLCLARDIAARDFHGSIKLDSREGEYTNFIINFPKK